MRGGKRKGAGRKKTHPLAGETVVIRIPAVFVDRVRAAIALWEDEFVEF